MIKELLLYQSEYDVCVNVIGILETLLDSNPEDRSLNKTIKHFKRFSMCKYASLVAQKSELRKKERNDAQKSKT